MNKKKILGLVVLLAIVCVSGTVYASQLLASSISFTPSKENKDKGFVALNVEEAINELYKKNAGT